MAAFLQAKIALVGIPAARAIGPGREPMLPPSEPSLKPAEPERLPQAPASGQRDRGRAARPAARAVLGPLILAAAPARAADPRPPQVAVGFTASPAPIMQGGVTKLFYELTLINVSPLRYTLA